MSTARFFAENLEVNADAYLTGEEFDHAKNVLRVESGEEVVLLDGSGYEYTAKVEEVGKKEIRLSVLKKERSDKEPKTEITLAFGYLKNADKNEFIVQKAVELGVSKLICFSSAFSSAYMNDNKLERLNKVAREATKQCKRACAPVVEYAENLQTALEKAQGENKIFACELETERQADFSSLSGSTVLVVGSEGGFSKDEETLAKNAGYLSVSLGKRILRAETAAVALTALTAYALGELGGEK